MSDSPHEESDGESGVATAEKTRVKPPPKYKVLLHNDDYTTMEFVIFVLQKVFRKTMDEAQEIMLKVHHNGVGVCGIYSYEIAESKVAEVLRLAKGHKHPLKCSMEPE